MDGERFDAWTRSLTVGASRRRVLAGLGALAGGLLGRGAAAQDAGPASCRERLGRCDRRDQCCEAQAGHRIGCARVSQECRRPERFPGGRCCGERDAVCSDSCDCCAGYACRDGRCASLDRVCLRNTCCECYRCAGEECTRVRCLTARTFRECIERCGPDADLIEGVSAPGTTFACRAGGRCRVACEDRRGAGREPTVERWEPAGSSGGGPGPAPTAPA